jgi:hypothetical protein
MSSSDRPGDVNQLLPGSEAAAVHRLASINRLMSVVREVMIAANKVEGLPIADRLVGTGRR